MRRAVAAMILLGGCADAGSSTPHDDASSGGTTAEITSTATTSDPTQPTSDPTMGDSTAGDTDVGCAIADPAAVTEIAGCPETFGAGACSEGQMHVPQDTVVEWMADPPHSGPHYPTWEVWGEHDKVVPRGNWVHNLEHGGIVLTYRCNDDCPEELAVLREVVAMRPDLRILLTKDTMLPGERFAAISWTWVYRTDAPDLATLLCFADQHENHAPEDIP